MKPSDRRKKLFSLNRPNIVPITELNQVWMINWQWIAYLQKGGDSEEGEFKLYAYNYLKSFDFIFILEDYHRGFSNGIGPIGYVGCLYDGWNLRPHVEWYPWARAANRVRCSVAFLSKMRGRRDIGMIWIESDDPGWLKFKRYLRIAKAGQAKKARVDGSDLYIFYVRGSHHGVHRQSIRKFDQKHINNNSPATATKPTNISAIDDRRGIVISH